jgi:hypothetical protein
MRWFSVAGESGRRPEHPARLLGSVFVPFLVRMIMNSIQVVWSQTGDTRWVGYDRGVKGRLRPVEVGSAAVLSSAAAAVVVVGSLLPRAGVLELLASVPLAVLA